MRLGWCKQKGRHWLALLCVMLSVQACTTTPHLRKVSSKLPPIRDRVAPPERRSPQKKPPQKKRAPFAKGVKLCQQSRWEEAEAYFLAQKKTPDLPHQTTACDALSVFGCDRSQLAAHTEELHIICKGFAPRSLYSAPSGARSISTNPKQIQRTVPKLCALM